MSIGSRIAAASALVAGVLVAEAKLARRVVGQIQGEPPVADGVYGPPSNRPALHLALLGDSSAAGLGVHTPEETTGAHLATALAEVAGRPVRLTNVAFSGARSKDLTEQVRRVLDSHLTPHIAVVMIGTNDVTHRVRPAVAVRHLGSAVLRLRAASVEVVVGTCPDLGTVRPIPQPLRLIARRWSRTLATAQTVTVAEAGARAVSLGSLLGPEFDASPEVFFGPDRFHPSANGYAACASAILPSVCEALGLWPEATLVPAATAPVLPIADAAAEAVDHPGTEVTATEVAGQSSGPRGRWARLRLRRIPAGTVERLPTS